MQRIAIVIASTALVVVVFFGVVIAASESGEVVTLTTRDAEGLPYDTRLWVVDHEGAQWLRTGDPDKYWYQRLLDQPIVVLERGGTTRRYVAVPVREPARAAPVQAAFADKYGTADWIVALSGDADDRVLVRLDPAPPDAPSDSHTAALPAH
jgi:hypothetical protein